jgi:hypothetical protein
MVVTTQIQQFIIIANIKQIRLLLLFFSMKTLFAF